MRIARFAHLYNQTGLYIELMFADVEAIEEKDALQQPFLKIRSVDSIMWIGRNNDKIKNKRYYDELISGSAQLKIFNYKEPLWESRPSTYIFELDNITSEDPTRNAIILIFRS